MLQGQLAHLAGADDQHRLVAEMIEHLADVIDRRTGDGHVPPGDARFTADALGHLAGVLKQRVQERPHGGGLGCRLVRLLDLAGDLALADDQAVEAGRHAEQVAHGVGVAVRVQVRRDLLRRDGVELTEEGYDRLRQARLAGQVQLDAVARRQDDRLALQPGGDCQQRLRQLVAVEGQALAQLDRGAMVVAAEGQEVHAAAPLPMWGIRRATSSSTKATMVSTASGRPRRCSAKRR